jgi:hypothetical protein
MAADEPWTEEERVTLAALGELPAEALAGDEQERQRAIAATVETLRELYAPARDSAAPGEAVGEFQLARMDQARLRAAAAAATSRRRPVWPRLALAAAVVLLGAVSYQILRQHPAGTPPALAQHQPAADPYLGTRGGSGTDAPATNAPADARGLAPLGEIRILRPLLFIWQADPTKRWTLRLYRNGESAPLAVAEQVSSPLPLEQLPGGPEIAGGGGSFRWELIDPPSGTIAWSAAFQVAADARTPNPAGDAERMAALKSAQREGRPSEALILLFSLHETLATETFIRLRKELEAEILRE